MSAWDVARQLDAHQQGRAVSRVGRAYAQIEDHALLLCPVAMAGWDPSLQAVAVGPRGRRAQVISCADPREWDLQLEAFSRLHAVLRPWMEQLAASDSDDPVFPQLIVPDAAATKILVGLAYRLAWLEVPAQAGKDRKRWSEDARQLGRLLLYFVQQMEIAGQQSVLTCTSLLKTHLAFGQDPGDHLGALLTWTDPPAGQDVAMAALEAERTGVTRATPEFDEQLHKLVSDFLKFKRGDPSRRSRCQRQIEDLIDRGLLAPAITDMHAALDVLGTLDLPVLPDLVQLRRREQRAFAAHMKHLGADGHFSKSDRPRAAVRGLTVMEDAGEQWAKAALWGDPVMLAKARFEGDVLHGIIEEADSGLVDVVSEQPFCKVRRGDELYLMADPGFEALVDGVRRDGDRTIVTLAVQDLLPVSDGDSCDWASAPPRWHMLGLGLGKVFRRLSSQPSTHRPDTPADAVSIPMMTEDPMDAIEGLQR